MNDTCFDHKILEQQLCNCLRIIFIQKRWVVLTLTKEFSTKHHHGIHAFEIISKISLEKLFWSSYNIRFTTNQDRKYVISLADKQENNIIQIEMSQFTNAWYEKRRKNIIKYIWALIQMCKRNLSRCTISVCYEQGINSIKMCTKKPSSFKLFFEHTSCHRLLILTLYMCHILAGRALWRDVF